MAVMDQSRPVQPAQPRVVRVFVSSTFSDMHAERDELVKRVFPQLRNMCEQRGVTRGEVDLRWGVTDEQAAEGQVLPICLEEIRRCRPYFVELLGERCGPFGGSGVHADRSYWTQESRGTLGRVRYGPHQSRHCLAILSVA